MPFGRVMSPDQGDVRVYAVNTIVEHFSSPGHLRTDFHRLHDRQASGLTLACCPLCTATSPGGGAGVRSGGEAFLSWLRRFPVFHDNKHPIGAELLRRTDAAEPGGRQQPRPGSRGRRTASSRGAADVVDPLMYHRRRPDHRHAVGQGPQHGRSHRHGTAITADPFRKEWGSRCSRRRCRRRRWIGRLRRGLPLMRAATEGLDWK